MSNLFKKVVATVSALTIVLSIVSPVSGVMAAYSTLEAANKLASLGVIVDNSANPANYRLGDSITRWEMAKITMKLSEQEVSDMCEGKFSDLTASNWACKYAEAGLTAGFFAANATFRPADSVTKIEALKMVMQARGIAKSSNSDWKAAYVEAAVEAGVLESSFSDFDAVAVRGWIFQTAVNAIEGMVDSGDDLLGDLLGGLDDTTDDTTTDDTTTGDDTVVSGDAVLTVSLSPETPAAATVPGSISGLAVASFDFTAGSEDVTVTSMTVARKGLSSSTTLTGLAAFTSEGRASKSKDDTLNNNTEATLTLTNGLVVKAGETKTVTIVADVAATSVANGAEFAIELKEVIASTSVETDGSLLANTMKVGWVDADILTVAANGSVTNPKIGEEQVDVLKFKLTWDNDSDVVLKSITFKAEGTNGSDAEEDMANFKLYRGTDLLAETAMMNGKYLTFNLWNGLTVKEDKNESLVVKADIVGGAADKIQWILDKKLDVTAIGLKYGYWAGISATEGMTFGAEFEIQAGQLTLVDMDAESTDIREDKKDVVLGTIKVTNVSGKDLELQKFTASVTTTGTGAENLLENVELVNEASGASYDLTLGTSTSTTATDTDLNIAIPQGTTTFLVRADTKKPATPGLLNGSTVTIAVDTSSATGFYVVETNDDKRVTDITPSSLSFKKLTMVASSATFSYTPLANSTVVRGAKNQVVSQFEIEAGKTSSVTIDEIKAYLSTTASGAADNKIISEVALYKGSVSDANLLDKVSTLATWVATLDGYKVTVAKNSKQTFVITANVVDGSDAEGKTINAIVQTWTSSISAEDEDNDDVLITVPSTTAKNLVVTAAWTVTVTNDANNTDNKDVKTVLAWDSTTVFSADIQATNEKVDAEIVEFSLTWSTFASLKNAIATASLYLGDTLIATNSNADITDGGSATIVAFKNLTTMIVPTTASEIKLKLNTSNIGYEKVGATVTNVTVTNLALKTIDWVDSGKSIADYSVVINSSKAFAVVPATVTASVVQTMSSSDRKTKVKFTVNDGNNSASGSNSDVQVDLTQLTFTAWGTYTGQYKIYVDGQSASFATGAVTSGSLVFSAANLNATYGAGVITWNETYVIEMVDSLTAGNNASLTLVKQGVQYSATNVDNATGLTTNATAELELGSAVGN